MLMFPTCLLVNSEVNADTCMLVFTTGPVLGGQNRVGWSALVFMGAMLILPALGAPWLVACHFLDSLPRNYSNQGPIKHSELNAYHCSLVNCQ